MVTVFALLEASSVKLPRLATSSLNVVLNQMIAETVCQSIRCSVFAMPSVLVFRFPLLARIQLIVVENANVPTPMKPGVLTPDSVLKSQHAVKQPTSVAVVYRSSQDSPGALKLTLALPLTLTALMTTTIVVDANAVLPVLLGALLLKDALPSPSVAKLTTTVETALR